MTTAVADIADLVKILRDQPEWAETLRAVLLTQELLELPEKVAQLTARLEEFIAQQQEANRLFVEQMARQNARIDEFIAEQKEINRLFAAQLARQEADTAELKSDMSEVKSDMAELKSDMAEVKSDVAELKATTRQQGADIAELKADVAELKSDMSEVKSDVAELKATASRHEADIAELKTDMSVVKSDVAELKTDMAGVKVSLGRLEGDVGRLKGADLERSIHAHIAATIGNPQEFRYPKVLKSIMVSPVPELFDLLYPALDDGRIDPSQFDSLMQTDIILSVLDRSAQLIYIAVEISRTVHDYDLTRARARADILAAASAGPALAFVIGYIIPPPQRRLADELGVRLLETPRLAEVAE